MRLSGRQPPALTYLFLTEMWERFGFYIIQGLLVLYLTEFYGFTDNEGYTIQGAFTAFVYMSPIAGGMLADSVLGAKNAIILGGIFLIIGYALLAISSAKCFFYFGIATIVVGNGLFKPNISSLLGEQYHEQDFRRDAGFTIFYMGINIGAGLAGLCAGYIRDYAGWNMSFAMASVGLLIGLAIFSVGLTSIKTKNNHTPLKVTSWLTISSCCVLAIIGLNFLFKSPYITTWLLPCFGLLLLSYLVMTILKLSKSDQKNMCMLVTLIISSIVYWMIGLQMFFSVNLYIDRLVDKQFLGFHLSTTVFFASSCLFILMLGPIFAWFWQFLSRKNINLSPTHQFIAGFIMTGLGCVVLGASALFPDTQKLVSPLWIFFAYFLMMIGDLLISPIGLSVVTTLAPSHLVGLMMGTWFVATGFGGYFGGMIARLASIPASIQNNTDKLAIFHNAFFDFAYIAFFTAVVLLLVQITLTVMLRNSEHHSGDVKNGIGVASIDS